MKRLLSLMTLTAIALLALAACGADVPGANDGGDSTASGTFEGRITIGPICPVEPCDFPEGAAYMGHDLKFIRSGGVFKVPLNTDGTFSVTLVPADYI